MVIQTPITDAIADVVEGYHAVRHKDMVSVKIPARNDPLAVKSVHGRVFEEGTREDGTGTVTEEDAVRQRPEFSRVFLDTVLQDIHALSGRGEFGFRDFDVGAF